jgi:NAD(P)-dependent dehydrogenase (short-subunit alcohol dehydrogenase family)
VTAPLLVVTGGASGIGEATARRFAEAGWRVLVADKNGSGAQTIAREVGGTGLACDVSREDDVRALGMAIDDLGTAPRALVHAAGITHPMVAPEEMSPELFRQVVDVDLVGTFLICKEIGRRMVAGGGGSIVTIGSSAVTTVLRLHAYGPAKTGVVQLTRQLAREWGRQGVRVNAISPGYVLTPPLADAIRKGLRSADKLKSMSVQDRIMEPSEIAAGAFFLCSDDARGITGHNLVMDAGWAVNGHWSVAPGEE